jgi:hypothetical protein
MKKEISFFLFFFPFSYRGTKMEKSEKIPVWYRGMKISGMKKEHAHYWSAPESIIQK